MSMSGGDDGMKNFSCPPGKSANSRIVMRRAYTPVLYYIQPKVVYYGSDISFYVDPKSSQDVNSIGNEIPFKEARINGFTIDFEGFIDESSVLPWN